MLHTVNGSVRWLVRLLVWIGRVHGTQSCMIGTCELQPLETGSLCGKLTVGQMVIQAAALDACWTTSYWSPTPTMGRHVENVLPVSTSDLAWTWPSPTTLPQAWRLTSKTVLSRADQTLRKKGRGKKKNQRLGEWQTAARDACN